MEAGRGPALPSPWLFRDTESPPKGLVGCFLDIAPRLLHAGRSRQSPPPAAVVDWWTDCVQGKLAVPYSSAVMVALQDEESEVADVDAGPDWWSEMVDAEFSSDILLVESAASSLDVVMADDLSNAPS